MNIESEFNSRFADYGGVNRSQEEIGSTNGNAMFMQANPTHSVKKAMNFSKTNLKSNQKKAMFFAVMGSMAFVLYSREKKNKTKGDSRSLPHTLSQKQEEPEEDPLFQRFTSVVISKKKSNIE